MSWAILFTSIGLTWVVWNAKRWKPFWLRAGLVFIVGASLAETGLGVWIAKRLNDLLGLFVTGAPATTIVSGVVLVGIVYVIYQLGDKSADKREMIVLVLLPTLCLVAVGPIAETWSGLSDSAYQVAMSSIGRGIGG